MIFLRIFSYFEQKLELPESRRKFIVEPMDKNCLQKFQNLCSLNCYLFTRAKMKCTYCLVDGILLMGRVFPSLFAIFRRPRIFWPFQTENFCKLILHKLQLGGNSCDLWLAYVFWRQLRKNNTNVTCDMTLVNLVPGSQLVEDFFFIFPEDKLYIKTWQNNIFFLVIDKQMDIFKISPHTLYLVLFFWLVLGKKLKFHHPPPPPKYPTDLALGNFLLSGDVKLELQNIAEDPRRTRGSRSIYKVVQLWS